METEFKIPIPGTDLNIYTKQYGSLDNPVVVFVHGFTGFMDEHMFYNGARYFHKHGISSVRFNLYDFQQDSRKLIDSTLSTHAEDVNTVVNYIKQEGAEKIFAIGHSYGAPSILLSNQDQFNTIVLWDGTNQFVIEEDTFIEQIQAYYTDLGPGGVTGRKMRDEAKGLDWDNLYKSIRVPVKVIWAEKEILVPKGKELFKEIQSLKEQVIIKGAGHTFSEEGAAEELFEESVNWIKKFV